jgi:succinate dehydrogenase / fumarate reductase cytochrome b subunit
MSTLVTTIRDAFRYRGKEGQLAWIGHRLAGLGTLLFFIIHVVDTSFVFFWPNGYEHAIALYRSVPFLIGELFLLLAVIYHGVNGLRIALMDWRPRLWRHQRAMTLGAFALVVALYIPVFLIMAGHIKNILAG